MKFILLRHCKTEWNDAGRLQGQTDIKLSRHGEMQAELLAEKIIDYRPALAVSSDLQRAAKTALIIAGKLGIDVHYDTRLRECSFGILEGKTWQEIEKQLGVKKEMIWRNAGHSYDFTPYGGESRKEVLNRHRNIFDEMVFRKEDRILVVGHGVGLSTILSDLGEKELALTGDIRIIDYPY